MSLIKEEKRTLAKFLLLYLGSSFVLFAVIAYLFYESESKQFYNKTQTGMQLNASQLASKIIYAHMSETPFSLQEVVATFHGKIGFYNAQNLPIVSSISESIDFTKRFYQDREKMILVNQSTFGHLGVQTIVIEQEGVEAYIDNLQQKIIMYLLLTYLFLTIVGYFLAKLFIRPIQQKRIQLDNFIKDSTHELNTPITALMLSVNVPNVASSKNLERIKLSAKRIAEIHKDLTYLMLDNTQVAPVVKSLLLNEIVQEELTYLTLLAEKKRIKLSVAYEEENYFTIDKESFIRLIHNLISNAIKYNKIGGTINVVVTQHQITIEDTGIGISQKEQASIYERFYRASDQVGGFGLGLNIVEKVCKLYNIGIEFESELNKGTIFRLRF